MEELDKLIRQTSIVIPTVDRLADLERCLASLRPFPAAEVVIANNGPHGGAIEEIAKRNNARVVTEPQRGVSRARNAGARAAAGTIVAFLDDDSVADPEWLPLLLAPFTDPQVLATVGSIAAQTLVDPVSQAFDGMHHADFPQSRTTLQALPEEKSFPLRPALVGNANMAVRREAFTRFGYFDVRFGRGTRIGSGEEPELLLRILLGGAKVVVEPAAQILHHHSTERRAIRRWAFTSGCAHTAILSKYFTEHPSLRRSVARYVASRLRRPSTPRASAKAAFRPPRMPFLFGSLFGPMAFFLSRNNL